MPSSLWLTVESVINVEMSDAFAGYLLGDRNIQRFNVAVGDRLRLECDVEHSPELLR